MTIVNICPQQGESLSGGANTTSQCPEGWTRYLLSNHLSRTGWSKKHGWTVLLSVGLRLPIKPVGLAETSFPTGWHPKLGRKDTGSHMPFAFMLESLCSLWCHYTVFPLRSNHWNGAGKILGKFGRPSMVPRQELLHLNHFWQKLNQFVLKNLQ